jgi:hypothetical protein
MVKVLPKKVGLHAAAVLSMHLGGIQHAEQERLKPVKISFKIYEVA